MSPVSLTLSPSPRLVALVGALVLTGAAAVLLLGRGALGGDSAATTGTDTLIQTTHAAHKPTSTPATTGRPAAPRQASGFPKAVDNALRNNKIVVVSVSMPGAAVDSEVRSEARAGAKAGRAGFVRLSALNEIAMSRLVAKAGVLPEPAVLIVKRPGAVVATFSVTDAGTVAQAITEARR
jgi:hypothetical protein